MKRSLGLISATLTLAISAATWSAPAARAGEQTNAPVKPKPAAWKFAASGDSRNCGDVVMPAIAAAVKPAGAAFFWHLGDFRKMRGPDEDIEHQPAHLGQPLSLPEYQQMAWTDFVEHQIAPFGSLRVYLAIGNHEMIPPKTRADYVTAFSRWLDAPDLRAQRLRDDPAALQPRIYFHWVQRGVDFISLDNATKDQFAADQLAWFERTLRSDLQNPRIRTIVVGMHKPLPESISREHSMNESPEGTESGLRVYSDLLRAQNENHRRVYVLASHSHIFMDGIFQTGYWREHGGILPGWIVGTAGAQRTLLPKGSGDARAAEMNVYGYLLGTVRPNGEIQFSFKHVNEPDIPASVVKEYTPEFVHWCFEENRVAH
jgi:calcineurin-like phosphoesterase family protein